MTERTPEPLFCFHQSSATGVAMLLQAGKEPLSGTIRVVQLGELGHVKLLEQHVRVPARSWYSDFAQYSGVRRVR